MKRNDALALRILSCILLVLLALATWGSQGPFWLKFVLGAACGIGISVLVIVCQKQLHWTDGTIYPSSAEMDLKRPG